MTSTYYRIKREKNDPSRLRPAHRYTFILYDRMGNRITSMTGNSPVPPQAIRDHQARLNSREVLNELGIY